MLRRVVSAFWVLVLLGAFALGNVQAAPVCSDAPGDADWILCEESARANLNIAPRGVTIGTTGNTAHGVHGRHTGSGHVLISVRSGARPTQRGVPQKPSTITTSGSGAHGVYGEHRGDTHAVIIGIGDVETRTTITTSGGGAHGVYGHHTRGSGSVQIRIDNAKVTTAERRAYGILGVVRGAANTGTLAIDAQGGSVKTAGAFSHGIYGGHLGSGNIETATGGGHAVTTTGPNAHGIYGEHRGSGNIEIATGGGDTVTTTGRNAHGVVAYHSGTAPARRMTVTIGGTVDASGVGARGVRVGRVLSEGAPIGVAALDAEGLRQQTVIVNGRVHGGSGTNAAGVFLAGGGRVVIGPKGSVGAASGIAILATGDVPPPNPNPDNIQVIKPRLRVDMNLAGRRVAEAIGDDWIINDGGGTTIYVNDVKLHDADTGVTDRAAPNGARNVRIKADGVRVTDRTTDPWTISERAVGVIADRDFSAADVEEPTPPTPPTPPMCPEGQVGTPPNCTEPPPPVFIEEYAPRAAVYEALPGFLFRLGAQGVEDEPIAWADSPGVLRM